MTHIHRYTRTEEHLFCFRLLGAGPGEQLCNVFLDVPRLEFVRVPPARPPRLVDQKLLKVPPDVCPLYRAPDEELGLAHEQLGPVLRVGQLPLEPGEDLVLLDAVAVHLLQHDELGLEVFARPHVLHVVEDLLPVRVLLVAELVARQAEYLELVLELVGKVVELLKVLRALLS